MEKDNLPQDEEISSEDLEQVSGGLASLDATAFKFMKLTTVATDFLKIDAILKK